MKLTVYSYANITHFRQKGFEFSLVLNVRVCPPPPSPKLKLTLTSQLRQNVGLRAEQVGSFPETLIDPLLSSLVTSLLSLTSLVSNQDEWEFCGQNSLEIPTHSRTRSRTRSQIQRSKNTGIPLLGLTCTYLCPGLNTVAIFFSQFSQNKI